MTSTRAESCRRVMRERWAGRRELWQKLINRQKSSGMSIAAFCKEEGVHTTSFYSWRRKLSEPVVETRPPFVSLAFSPDGGSRPNSGVSVCIGSDIRVELEQGFSSDDLLRVVQALGGL